MLRFSRSWLTAGLATGLAITLALGAATPPPGYRVLERDGWSWCVPGGRPLPPEDFDELFGGALRRVRRTLEVETAREPLVIRAPTTADFRRAVEHYGGGTPGPQVTAIAFPGAGVMILDGERLGFLPALLTPETVVHEIVHLVIGESEAAVPRWYHEGLAQLLSGRRLQDDERQRLAWMARRQRLLPVDDLSVWLPDSHRMENDLYRQSLCYVTFVDEERGRPVHARLLAELRGGGDLAAAYAAVTGESLAAAEQRWRERLAREASWLGLLSPYLGLFQLLALAVVVGFVVETWRRRRRLRRLRELEEAEGDPAT